MVEHQQRAATPTSAPAPRQATKQAPSRTNPVAASARVRPVETVTAPVQRVAEPAAAPSRHIVSTPPVTRIQRKAGDGAGPAAAAQAPAPATGLPDKLKAGIESLSGMSMDHVKVHYNSDQPAQLNALAYAQGTDIHIAPGQDKHLPHEAWHVIQQQQGRAKPTMHLLGGAGNDPALEAEADQQGALAAKGAAPAPAAPGAAAS